MPDARIFFARIDNALHCRHVGSVVINSCNGRYVEVDPGRSFVPGVELR